MSLPPVSEKAFQGQVLELADLYGWMVFHSFLSIRSAPGWPDLFLCRPPRQAGEPVGRIVVAELKTEHGRVTASQQLWLDVLAACGLDVFVWRPSDLEQIARILT